MDSSCVAMNPTGGAIGGAGPCHQPCSCVNVVLARRRVSRVHEPPGADPHAVVVWGGPVKSRPLPDWAFRAEKLIVH